MKSNPVVFFHLSQDIYYYVLFPYLTLHIWHVPGASVQIKATCSETVLSIC